MATQSAFDYDQKPLPDPSRRKHGGDENSEAANARVHQWKPFWEAKIGTLLDQAGLRGMTSSEISIALGTKEQPVAKNLFSGRLRDMWDDGRTFRPGKREGEWINVLSKFKHA
jgi:hypothetical protein